MPDPHRAAVTTLPDRAGDPLSALDELAPRLPVGLAGMVHLVRPRGPHTPLPAAPEAITSYLTTLAGHGVKVGTMSRRLSALKFAHQLRNLPDPTTNARVVAVWEGIRRLHGAPPDQATPLIHRSCGTCWTPAQLRGCGPTDAVRLTRAWPGPGTGACCWSGSSLRSAGPNSPH